MTIKTIQNATLFGVVSLHFACASPDVTPEAMALAGALSKSCLGEVMEGGLSLLGPGNSTMVVPLPGAQHVNVGRVLSSGTTLLGWTATGTSGWFTQDLEGGTVKPLKLKLSDDFDVSHDGSFAVGRSADGSGGYSGLLGVDIETNHVRVIASEGKRPAISPNDRSVLFEDDGAIKLHQQGKEMVTVAARGMWPSWSPDGREAIYLSDDGSYHAVRLSDGRRNTIHVTGKAVRALRWSADGHYAAYIRHDWSDEWLSPPSCPERFRVVVRDVAKDQDIDLHWACTLYPERHHWINSARLCASRPVR
jgi:hypothetical protein